MKKLVLICTFVFFSGNLFCQEETFDRLSSLFEQQLKVFPQEKIYLHTDKPYYISGERIWFRAHLVNASSHVPVFVSKYIYVELINPLQTVVARVKIREADSVYSGYIDLLTDLPEGDYTLRAYTHFMQNLDEHYFCTKNIRILNAQSGDINVDVKFNFVTDEKITADIQIEYSASLTNHVSNEIKFSVNDGKQKNIKLNNNFASVTFDLSNDARNRVMLLEIEENNIFYCKFIQIPVPDDDFDVTFYPEGGNMLEGTFVKVAIKALKSNGKSTEVKAVIYDNVDKEISQVSTDYLGMGLFGICPEKGRTYYAVCTNEKGKSKRFDLPNIYNDRYGLSVTQRNNKLYISVLKSANIAVQDTLYLFCHTRGVVHCAYMLPPETSVVVAPTDSLTTGVLQLLLLNSRLQPLNERLVFVNNNNQAKVGFRTDKESYAKRSLVETEITLSDINKKPLIGNFSVSITDDNDVVTDTSNNILASLLLTSELRGNIEHPASYFNNTTSARNLDLLMMTQGWRRYDVAALIGGELSYPSSEPEIGAKISGTVKNSLSGKASVDNDVVIFDVSREFYGETKTDKNGRFYFLNCDFPDTTKFVIHATPNKTFKMIRDLSVDEESYPNITLTRIENEKIDRNVFTKYADKAEQKYEYEHGVRLLKIDELTVKAKPEPKPKYESVYYNMPDYRISEETIKKFSTTTNIYNLFLQVPGVRVENGAIRIRSGVSLSSERSPLIFLDGNPASLDEIVLSQIGQIDILKDAKAVIFGFRGSGGAIMFYTKDIEDRLPIEQPHVKFITPLGYQHPTEFYSPKYDKPQESNVPDLRTTIHWQPLVKTDQAGKATFDFYTADSESVYTVVIEGVTIDGKIIYERKKILISAK